MWRRGWVESSLTRSPDDRIVYEKKDLHFMIFRKGRGMMQQDLRGNIQRLLIKLGDKTPKGLPVCHDVLNKYSKVWIIKFWQWLQTDWWTAVSRSAKLCRPRNWSAHRKVANVATPVSQRVGTSTRSQSAAAIWSAGYLTAQNVIVQVHSISIRSRKDSYRWSLATQWWRRRGSNILWPWRPPYSLNSKIVFS